MDNNDIENLSEIDEELKNIIVNITKENEDEVELILKFAKKSLDFLKVYKNHLDLLENELLSHLMPCILKNVEKILNENITIGETAADDFIIAIHKSNLQTADEFIVILKDVLFFLESLECNFKFFQSIPENSLCILELCFKHCQESQVIYGEKFKNELLKLFHSAQNAFLSYIKLFNGDFEDLQALNKILQHFCRIAEILATINMKLMSTAWKHFLAIVTKSFQDISDFNMPFFIGVVLNIITNNFDRFSIMDSNLLQTEGPTLVKVTGFLVKVGIKLFDIFWKFIDQILDLIIKFVLATSHYSIHLENIIFELESKDETNNIKNMMETIVFQNMNGFIIKLINEKVTEKLFEKHSIDLEVLEFFNIILQLKISMENGSSKESIQLLKTIFEILENPNAHLILDQENLFDRLLVNATALILTSFEDNATYSQQIGSILLQNILIQKQNILASIFALEIITLFLKNVDVKITSHFLIQLAENITLFNFGAFTNAPQKIFISNLFQRLFKVCPKSVQNDANQILANSWRFESKKSVKEMNCKEFINMIILFHFNPDCDRINEPPVFDLWLFNNANEEIANNHFFHLFSIELIKRTILHLPAATIGQIISIMSQLDVLATNSNYKLAIIEFLLALTEVKSRKLLQNVQVQTLSRTILTKLLKNSNKLVRLKACALIHNLSTTHGLAQRINNYTDDKTIQGEMNNYLSNVSIDSQSMHLLSERKCYQFRHVCIEREGGGKGGSISSTHAAKRLKIDEAAASRKIKEQEEDSSNEDDVSEILARIKGEIKCLERACKSQDRSKSNWKKISDIKTIIAKLESFLN